MKSHRSNPHAQNIGTTMSLVTPPAISLTAFVAVAVHIIRIQILGPRPVGPLQTCTRAPPYDWVIFRLIVRVLEVLVWT